MRRFVLLAALFSLAAPAFADTPPEVALLNLEQPLLKSTEVGIPGVVELVQLEQGQPLPAPGPTVGQQVIQGLIQYVLVPGLAPLGALLLFALKKLVDYLNTKADESKLAMVGAKLTGAAASAVAEINVTLRPKLEAALADGVLTDKEKAELKDAALTLLKSKLPAELMKTASAIFGGFLDTYLGGLVERNVLEQKALAARVP